MRMKQFTATLLLLLTAPAMALDACMTGSWYAPDRNGEGIVLEILENTTVGYFYTYGSQGRAWYVMVGDEFLTVYGTALLSRNPFSVLEVDVGSAIITSIDDNTLRFKYSLTLDVDKNAAIPWCLNAFCDGDYVYQRLTQPIKCD